jgi:DNA-binding NarL/FixJ family response regulator
VRVVIAEDQVLLREGLARLFEDAGHEVIASVGDAERLLPAVAGHHPDLVVVVLRRGGARRAAHPRRAP